jgi:hypothetical protein
MRKPWLKSVTPYSLLALVGVSAALAAVALAEPSARGKFVVHEWGTFLSVQGSDGVTLGGMVDSEEDLPPFVCQRELNGLSRARMCQKMETPVTYFYSDRPRQVSVKVAMPRGLLTHWFPSVQAFGPPRGGMDAVEAGSFLDWGPFDVIPDARAPASRDEPGQPRPSKPRLCRVREDSTWRFARETDSALVKLRAGDRDCHEKFLFYRGLGAFDLPLEVRASGSDDELRLTLRNRDEDPLRGLFAIRVEKATIRFASLGDLAGGSARALELATEMGARLPQEDGIPQVKEAVTAALVEAGLYEKEARAMVNTWEKSYFRTEGLRLLSILPRPAVDAVIPIQVSPAPSEIVRVMIGRVEVLTPDMERRIEEQLSRIDATDPKASAAAVAELDRLGRLGEPVLRRVLATTRAAEVRTQAEKLLARAATK